LSMVAPMTAYEVIDQIKTMPTPERDKVLDFVLALKAAAGHQPVRIADDRAFNAAARRVFAGHTDLMRKLSQ